MTSRIGRATCRRSAAATAEELEPTMPRAQTVPPASTSSASRRAVAPAEIRSIQAVSSAVGSMRANPTRPIVRTAGIRNWIA
ncbi:MAG: hypothetical protein ACYTF4_13455 [Planctomycetota bacterium]